MAIQIPNPGTGNGATGDNEFVLWSKVKDNFSDQTNAASRLVGTTTGRIPLAENIYQAYNDIGNVPMPSDLDELYAGGTSVKSSQLINSETLNKPFNDTWTMKYQHMRDFGVIHAYGSRSKHVWVRTYATRSGGWGVWGYYYTSANTKLDTNGAIAPSSPTIDLYSDRIETNADGARMNPEFVRNGVGDYTIKNTTGLRDEGWYIKIPNDMNGNPKVAVAVDTDKDGNLSIKTYKRTFSMETFTFIPDLETPLDVPEGRWIDLRFNDLPQDDTQPEEVALDK